MSALTPSAAPAPADGSPLLFVPRGLPDPDASTWAPLASQILGDLAAVGNGLLVAAFERASERRRADLLLRGLGLEPQGLPPAGEDLASGVVLADRTELGGRPALLGAATCLVVSRLPLPWPRPPWIPAPEGEDPARFVRHDLPEGVAAFRSLTDPFLATTDSRPRLLAVLDPRLTDRPYGRWFLDVLRGVPRTRDLDVALATLRRGAR